MTAASFAGPEPERTTRIPGERPLDNRARKLATTAHRAAAREAEARETREDAEAQLAALHAAAVARFGRDIPANALILDVLEQIDVVEGDRWLWRGMRNNKGLPTLRIDRNERSLTATWPSSSVSSTRPTSGSSTR